MDSWRVRCVDTSAFAAELAALWLLLNSLKEELGAMRQRRNIFILTGCQSVLDVASGRAVLDKTVSSKKSKSSEWLSNLSTICTLHGCPLTEMCQLARGRRGWKTRTLTSRQRAHATNVRTEDAQMKGDDESTQSNGGRIVLKKQHNGLPMPFAQPKMS